MANFSGRRSWAEDDSIEFELFVDDSYPDVLNQAANEFLRVFHALTADALAADGAGDVE